MILHIDRAYSPLCRVSVPVLLHACADVVGLCVCLRVRVPLCVRASSSSLCTLSVSSRRCHNLRGHEPRGHSFLGFGVHADGGRRQRHRAPRGRDGCCARPRYTRTPLYACVSVCMRALVCAPGSPLCTLTDAHTDTHKERLQTHTLTHTQRKTANTPTPTRTHTPSLLHYLTHSLTISPSHSLTRSRSPYLPPSLINMLTYTRSHLCAHRGRAPA
jgi:hypothetical protein